jgi:hypothetical protein
LWIGSKRCERRIVDRDIPYFRTEMAMSSDGWIEFQAGNMVVVACSTGHYGSRLGARDGANARKERDLSFPHGRRID